MDKEQGQTMMEVMNSLDGVTLREKHGGNFKFRMYMTKEMMSAPIEVLDLSMRPANCLKRAGFKTVGDVVKAVAPEQGIGNLRNCGKKSVREIKEQLFLFNYNCMDAKRQEAYLQEVVLLNTVAKVE